MRFAILAIVLLLAGCAVPLENPRTGETATCTEGALDLSPWSQREACVAAHIAQGWTISEDKRAAAPATAR